MQELYDEAQRVSAFSAVPGHFSPEDLESAFARMGNLAPKKAAAAFLSECIQAGTARSISENLFTFARSDEEDQI